MKIRPLIEVVVGISCVVLAVIGIACYNSDANELPITNNVNLEDLNVSKEVNRNPSYSDSIVIGRGGSPRGDAVELDLEREKGHVNGSGWNDYTISITNLNMIDVHKTIILEGTRYNWDSNGWVPDSSYEDKLVATIENITVHPGDTVKITVPVQLKATGNKNLYIFKVRSDS